MKVVVVGDNAVPLKVMLKAAENLDIADPEITGLQWGEMNSESFRHRAHHLELEGPDSEEPAEGLYEAVRDADILLVHFCPVSKNLISCAENLRLIMTCRGGVEHIDIPAATQKNIAVMHVIRNAEAASDFTIGMIIAETRNIARGHAALKNGEWRKKYPNNGFTKALYEMKLGVIGLGSIGRLVAKKAASLGMEVSGCDPFVTQEDLNHDGIFIKLVERDELWSQSDIVSIHLRVTPETEGYVNRDLLHMMKKEAYLINTSRAAVIDKQALIEALRNNDIAGAAIDVFWDEPVSPDDDLLALDNVTLTPHMAGSVKSALENSPYLAVRKINEFIRNRKSSLCLNGLEWRN